MNSQTQASLKAAIRKLIHSSQVKPEAVQVIVEGLENKEVTPEYWETLFNNEGAEIAIKQKIYSPQLVRLMTLRAMVISESLPQFLAWLNIQAGKKPDESQTVSLEFQKGIRALFPKEQLTKGIKYLLLNLLNKKISVDSLCWLLMIDGSASVYARKEFITDVKYDLQLICNYFSVPRTLSKSSYYPDFPSGNNSQLNHVQPPIKRDLWQIFFKRQKEIWATLISNWEGIQQGYYKGEEYQPFAELFEKFNQYDLAAYFYQVSDGIVDKDLYYKVANQQNSSSPVVFGLEIKPKKNLIDHVLDFITLEIDMKIRFVVPISLFILVSGWFIGTKTWQPYTSATEIEKSLCSKTFQDGKNCPVIVLDPTTSYGFSEIKRVIPAVVDEITKQKKGEEDKKYKEAIKKYDREINQGKSLKQPEEKTEESIKQEVIGKLVSILKNTELKYEDLSPGKEATDLKTQKQWVTAIYNYQVKRNVTYQKIIADANNGSEDNKCNLPFGICLWPLGQNNDTSNGVNEKDSELYKKLRNDILYYMKSQQPQTTTTNNNQKEVNKNELKDKQKAINDYTQAIKINPNYADAYYGRGYFRNELGDKQGAIDDYNQAIKINPNYAEAYNNRGIVRDELGDKQGAIDDYTQAIKINPNHANAYNNRGNVRKDLGDKQGAIDDFQQAAKLYQQQGKNEDYQDALNRIRELQQ